MSRTQRTFNQDNPQLDGHIYVPVLLTEVTGAGAAISNSVIANTTSISLPTTATAYVATIPLGPTLFRYGVRDDTQEAFGAGGIGATVGSNALAVGNASTLIGTTVAASPNAAVALPVTTPQSTVGFVVGQHVLIDTGANAEIQQITAISAGVSITVAHTNITHTATFPVVQNPFTSPVGAYGSPPFTGQAQLTPATAPRPKGIQINAIYPVYQIGAVNATVNTIALKRASFANNVAPTVSDLIASGANGLQTAFQAATLAYVTPIVVPTPAFEVTRFTQVYMIWSITTGAAGTAAMFGVFVDCSFNYS